MSIFDEVLKHIDGNAIAGISQQLGTTPQQAQSAIQVALPAILGGMQRNIANGGAEQLYHAVNKDHQGIDLGGLMGSVLGNNGGGGLLESVMGMMGGGASQPERQVEQGGAGGLLGSVLSMMGSGTQQQSPNASAGMGILKHVLGGSQDRAANGVSQASGLSGQGAMALMAMLAPMVMAALGKMTANKGLDAGGLAGAIGGDLQRLGQNQPAQQKGFMGGLLDADGDGDVDASDLLSRGSLLMGLFGKR